MISASFFNLVVANDASKLELQSNPENNKSEAEEGHHF